MMNKCYRCLIVDDEPPASRLLENYVSKVPFLELVGVTASALEALRYVETNAIDVIFLDIQMPELSGIQLSKIIKDKVQIIFTTAYPQFALESYDFNAVDYLLKPFEFERFYEAVGKLKGADGAEVSGNDDDSFVFVKTDGKNNYEKIAKKDVCYIEGLKNYVAVHLEDKPIITYATLRHMEAVLGAKDFVQIHKSYIVAIRHIEKIDSLSVYLNEKALPIGDTYRKGFFEVVERYKL
jgi:DNA-binding LytR/AlgR family response regulator